jgi:excisionase family DNA binding protein
MNEHSLSKIGLTDSVSGNPTPETLLSYAQAAQRLGVSRETIYRYQRAGKLPAIRLSSKTVRFRVSDLARLLAGADFTSSWKGGL